MSDSRGPWDQEPSTPSADPAPPRGRVVLWLLLVGGLALIVVALARAFPEANLTGQDWAQAAYLCGFLLLLSVGALRASRTQLRQHLRYAVIWVGVVAVAAVGLAYRDELSRLPRRLQVAFSNGDPVATGDHQLAVPQDDSGHYLVVGQVNGQRVRFLIDTGASDTVLSPADAQRIGVDVASLRFDDVYETANGAGSGARFTADRLEVGAIRFDRFPLTVNQAPISTSLLGMSFLSRLESFEFRGRQLILKWRDAPA